MFWNLLKLLYTILLVNTVNCSLINLKSDLITTRNGILKGENRGKYFSFEGIPYAEPPINDNRFEPPRPIKNWSGVKNATKPSSVCMQWSHTNFDKDRLEGSEDCLYLNVYRSEQEPDNDNRYPVVVYFHGGAFMFGSGDGYGPAIIVRRPLIYVSVNYRLGPLGFLATEDEIVPGNMGLKDQSMALKWIHDNIDSFGGNPNKITIAGFSAGGASVHLHYLSKLSANLFQNGISHSGCALNPWVFTENPLKKAEVLAENVGCSISSTREMIKCLKDKPSEVLVRSVSLFQPFLYNPFTPFGPVVESIESNSSFISESPISLLEKGLVQNKPWLVSAVESEGIYPAFELLRNESSFISLNDNWSEYGAAILHLTDTVELNERDDTLHKIRKHYLGEKTINFDTFSDLVKIITDYLYVIGIQRSVKLQSKHSSAPVYFYHFKFSAAYGLEQALTGRNDVEFGVSHGDDVVLIYDTILRGDQHPYNGEELEMQSKLLDLYYNYAEYGRLAFGDLDFEPAKEDDENSFKYLNILAPNNATFRITDDIAEDYFWKQFKFY